MADKIFQVVIYEDEDRKLAELAEHEERSRSAEIRFLINREYLRVFPPHPVKTEPIERGS